MPTLVNLEYYLSFQKNIQILRTKEVVAIPYKMGFQAKSEIELVQITRHYCWNERYRRDARQENGHRKNTHTENSTGPALTTKTDIGSPGE